MHTTNQDSFARLEARIMNIEASSTARGNLSQNVNEFMAIPPIPISISPTVPTYSWENPGSQEPWVSLESYMRQILSLSSKQNNLQHHQPGKRFERSQNIVTNPELVHITNPKWPKHGQFVFVDLNGKDPNTLDLCLWIEWKRPKHL